MNLLKKKETIYSCLFVLLVLCIYEYGIQKIYGFSILGDEFGYWSNAAAVVGYDWKACAQRNAYYSYGYGLLLSLPLALCRTSLSAYRMAVAMNGVFLCGSFFMMRRILEHLFVQEDSTGRFFALMVAAFYPVSAFYMQMTLTETLLLFLYSSVCYLMLRFQEDGRIRTLLTLILVLVYMFFVHMRSVGTIIACGMVLCAEGIRNPKYRKALGLGLAVLLVSFILGMLLKHNLTEAVYGDVNASMQDGNDIGGQVSRFARLFSAEGVKHLWFSCMGKLFYIGMASFGTVYFAVGYAVRNMKNSFSRFLLLSLLGQLGVSAIFMSHPGRVDTLIYGRYNDFILPVFIGIGLLSMYTARHLIWKVLAYIMAHGCILPILTEYVKRVGVDRLLGYFAAGIGYTFPLTKGGKIPDPASELWKAYFVMVILSLILLLLVCVVRRFREFSWILVTFVCIEIYGSILLSNHFTYFFNEVNLECLGVIDYLAEHERQKILYLDDGGYPYVDLVQFYLPEHEVEIWDSEDLENGLHNIYSKERYMIVTAESDYLEDLKEIEKPVMEGANLVLFEIETEK